MTNGQVNPTIVILGGCGFIGSHMAQAILETTTFNVYILDNLSTGDIDNIDALLDKYPERLSYKLWNIMYGVQIPLRYAPISAIVHLASPASPKYYLNHKLDTIYANSFGTFQALNAAKEHGSRFLLASTSEIYGDPSVHPQYESYHGNVDTMGPRACYDESKRFAETLTYTFGQTHNVDTRIARIFNTFGPNMKANDGRVIPTFIRQALHNEPITIIGDGTHTRSYTYIDDTVRGLMDLLFADPTRQKHLTTLDPTYYREELHTPINIGNPEEITLNDLAKEIIELTSSTSKITYLEDETEDPHQRKPSIMKAQAILGWKPRITRREGLEKLIKSYSY